MAEHRSTHEVALTALIPSVRRLLTAETANPTTENAFLLLEAMGIRLEAVLPSGARVEIV